MTDKQTDRPRYSVCSNRLHRATGPPSLFRHPLIRRIRQSAKFSENDLWRINEGVLLWCGHKIKSRLGHLVWRPVWKWIRPTLTSPGSPQDSRQGKQCLCLPPAVETGISVLMTADAAAACCRCMTNSRQSPRLSTPASSSSSSSSSSKFLKWPKQLKPMWGSLYWGNIIAKS